MDDESVIEIFVETYLTIKDFYTSFIISQMRHEGMIDADAYKNYLHERADILLNNEEEEHSHGGSGQGQDESTGND